jgi:diguanylate cyclase (GGDEF)-like protein
VADGSSSADTELVRARAKFGLVLRSLCGVAVILIAGETWIASVVAGSLARTATAQHLIAAGLIAGVAGPLVFLSFGVVTRQLKAADAAADARQFRLDEQGRRRDLESQLSDALDMAESENEVLHVIERGFTRVLPLYPAALLLADNSQAHLTIRAQTTPAGALAGCDVSSPQGCPAARRARVHRFTDSDAVNACPKLANREQGRCAALCIPVSVMGRTVGVIHSVQTLGAPISDATVQDLQSIANQAGARLGMLRVMADTQLQASTDGLTGLLNRRAFEDGYLSARSQSRRSTAVVAMADLDHFKLINDTYGHDTGDRALRLFAETLRGALRDQDVLSRRGGEEFAIAFPDCDLDSAAAALQRVRVQLQEAISQAGLPAFTVSFGVVPAGPDDPLDVLLARADSALFEAKRAGRDRIVVHDNIDVAVTDPAALERIDNAIMHIVTH